MDAIKNTFDLARTVGRITLTLGLEYPSATATLFAGAAFAVLVAKIFA